MFVYKLRPLSIYTSITKSNLSIDILKNEAKNINQKINITPCSIRNLTLLVKSSTNKSKSR